MGVNIKERTIEFVKSKGITMKAFEKKCGLSTGYVTSMRKGFGQDKLRNVLTAFPELNRDWLLYGEGDMLKDNAENNSVNNPHEEVHGSVVPLLPILAHGGRLTDFECSVSRYECEKVVSPIDGVDLAITISGDSMAPEYPSGSRVLIKKVNERAFIEWGKVYVLDTCNGTIIKQLMPHEDPSCVRCVSLNSAYPPFDLSLNYVHAIYRVLLCMAMK